MGKYLNMDVSGVQTPLKISDVATIVVNGAGTATTITYDNGGTSVIILPLQVQLAFLRLQLLKELLG